MNPAMGLSLYAAFMKAGAEASFSSSPIPRVGKVFAKVKEASVFRGLPRDRFKHSARSPNGRMIHSPATRVLCVRQRLHGVSLQQLQRR
jgi:hypothetical protein